MEIYTVDAKMKNDHLNELESTEENTEERIEHKKENSKNENTHESVFDQKRSHKNDFELEEGEIEVEGEPAQIKQENAFKEIADENIKIQNHSKRKHNEIEEEEEEEEEEVAQKRSKEESESQTESTLKEDFKQKSDQTKTIHLENATEMVSMSLIQQIPLLSHISASEWYSHDKFVMNFCGNGHGEILLWYNNRTTDWKKIANGIYY